MKEKILTGSFIVLFALFALLGLKTSEGFFADPTPTPAPELALAEEPTVPEAEDGSQDVPPTLAPRGEKVLIFFTSREDEQPTALDGVWLLAADKEQDRGNFLPVLPSQAADGQARDQILRSAFSLSGDGQPGEDVFRVLEERELTWDGYLVLDRDTLEDLLATLPAGAVENTPRLGELVYRAAQRENVRTHQASFLGSMCDLFQRGQVTGAALEASAALLNQPGLADTSAASWTLTGGEIHGQQPLECLFPTLP